MCANFYHEQVVVELLVSNEELEYDIVKEALEGGGGKSNENKKKTTIMCIKIVQTF